MCSYKEYDASMKMNNLQPHVATQGKNVKECMLCNSIYIKLKNKQS